MTLRFTLQPSQEQGFWVATDNENEIEIKFREHEFNETQEVTLLGDKVVVSLRNDVVPYIESLSPTLSEGEGEGTLRPQSAFIGISESGENPQK